MKSVLVVGQAMPRIKSERPFGRTRLYAWLGRIGIDDDTVLQGFTFTALVSHFPGRRGRSDRPPSPREIAAGRASLVETIRIHRPGVVIPVGILAAREILGMEDVALEAVVGERYRCDPFGSLGKKVDIIPLPHPSGASPWIFQIGHDRLLDAALQHVSDAMRSHGRAR